MPSPNLETSFVIPDQRVESECRVSADLRPKDVAYGAMLYMEPNGMVSPNPNSGGTTNPFIGRCLGVGKFAATVNVLTNPLPEPEVKDAVTQLGDIVR